MKRHWDWNISIPESAADRIFSTSERDTATRSRYTIGKVSLAKGNNRQAVKQKRKQKIQIKSLHTSEKDKRFESFQSRERKIRPKLFCKVHLFILLVKEQSRMICSNPNKVSKGECIKKIRLLSPPWTFQVVLLPKYKFSTCPPASTRQQRFCS